MTGVVIGTRGWSWRAAVTESGTVVPADGSPPLDWWIAADDRWHVPAGEASRRQRRVLGAPVVETAVAVPGGDVVHRAYAAVSGAGAAAVVELENRSALPVAVAFSRDDVDSGRPRAATPPGAPSGARTVVPLAHGATVRVVLGGTAARATMPAADVVARGWVAQTQLAARYDVPDAAVTEAVVAARCDALLGAVDPFDDVEQLLAAAERVALGDEAEPWVDDVAERAIAVAKRARRGEVAWDVPAAVAAAALVLAAAGQQRGAADVGAMGTRLGPPGPDPERPPAGIRVVPWLSRRLVRARPGGLDLLPGFAAEWAGQGVEVHDAVAGEAVVGYAVRWHGERPALIWDVRPARALRCPALDAAWSSDAGRGEALLAPFSPGRG